MKMSDIFDLPLEVRDDLVFFSKSDTCYVKVESVASRKEEVEVSSAIHKAINNHDRLEQENAELREALRRIRNWNDLGLTGRIDIGADGVRDYYRNVADLALNK